MVKVNLLKNRLGRAYQCGSLKIKIAETDKEFKDVGEIRIKVFEIEQEINAAQDFDGKDAEAIHIIAYIDEAPTGTARIRHIEKDRSSKIERVAVLPEFRKRGIGSQIIRYAIYLLRAEEIKVARLNAQEHLVPYYEQYGFRSISDAFDLAGIRHIAMEKRL